MIPYLNPVGPGVFRIQNVSDFRKTLYEVTRSVSSGQLPIIKHTSITAAYYMKIHTKWDKECNTLYAILSQVLPPCNF